MKHEAEGPRLKAILDCTVENLALCFLAERARNHGWCLLLALTRCSLESRTCDRFKSSMSLIDTVREGCQRHRNDARVIEKALLVAFKWRRRARERERFPLFFQSETFCCNEYLIGDAKARASFISLNDRARRRGAGKNGRRKCVASG